MLFKQSFLVSLFISQVLAQSGIEKQLKGWGHQSPAILKKLLKQEMVVESTVSKVDKKQVLEFYALGLHQKKCSRVLPKMSLYENYHKWLPFVTSSTYDETTKRVDFILDSSVLPMKMNLNFKIPRIKKPGVYLFHFDKGFLSGLQGKIHVVAVKKKCLIQTTADWKGKDSGIPNLAFEFFTEVLTKTGMGIVFRKTKF